MEMADRILWAGLGGLVTIWIAIIVCRFKVLAPEIKVWTCRLAMAKLVASLIWMMPVASSGVIAGTQPSAELILFLLVCWAAGMLTVAWFGVRGYLAVLALRRRSHTVVIPAATREKVNSAEVEGLTEPCVVGIFRPILLIPKGHVPSSAILQHEVAHIRHLDPIFGLLAWSTQAIFWFLPGIGKLLSEHSLWQEVWADSTARRQLTLAPGLQAKALIDALAKTQPCPAMGLGFRGDAAWAARRIEAMFAGKHSILAFLIATVIVLGASFPLRVEKAGVGSIRTKLYSPVASRIGG